MLTKIRSLTPEQQQEHKDFLLNLFRGKLEQKLSYNTKQCPHCNSTSLKSAGSCRGKKRYKCKSCKKTFGDTNDTAFYHSKLSPAQWLHFIELMFSKPMGLKKIAAEVGIHYVTAFYWRHKLLHAVQEAQDNGKFAGIVEADETYIPLSFKGQRSGLPRKARKRGGEVTKRGLSKEQVCVLTAMDRNSGRKSSLMQSTCLATPTAAQIANVLGPRISAHNAVLVTDGMRAYGKFARNAGLSHHVLDSATARWGGYHVQNINSLHSNFKTFMKTFRGVATKYLDHYLTYYKWTEQDAVAAVTKRTSSVTRNQLRHMCMTLK